MSQSVVCGPPKVARIVLPVLLLLSAGTLLAALLLSPPQRKTDESIEVAPDVVVPEFAFTDRSGDRVTNADLLGKVWIASFIFTRCEGTCPKVTATLYELQKDLSLVRQPDLRFVTFTMDPDFDTPAVLQKYAEDSIHRAESDRWLFLAGSNEKVRELMGKTFKLAFEKNADPTTPPGRKYDHGTFIFVVDKSGRVRGHFDGLRGASDETGEQYYESRTRLIKTVNKLLAE